MEGFGLWQRLRAGNGSDQPSDEKSSWRTLESLKSMLYYPKYPQDVDFRCWLAALEDTLHTALPPNSKLLEELDKLMNESSDDSKKDECRKKALGLIDMTERILVLNQPASSGLQQEIRTLITKEFIRSWPFWGVVVLWLSLCGAVFGFDWYYASKARQIIIDMQRQLDGARAAVFENTSDLNKITAKAKDDLNTIVAKAQTDLTNAVSKAKNSVDANGNTAAKGIEQTGKAGREQIEKNAKEFSVAVSQAKISVENSRKEAVDGITQAGKTGQEQVNKEWSVKVEQVRKQTLQVKQVPWTGWLFGGGYAIWLLSLVLSFLALLGAFINYHVIRRSALARK